MTRLFHHNIGVTKCQLCKQENQDPHTTTLPPPTTMSNMYTIQTETTLESPPQDSW